ncbi:MAG: DNA/RNA non-specific endonuclease [Chryseotalea sp.]|jgi:endonuclease G
MNKQKDLKELRLQVAAKAYETWSRFQKEPKLKAGNINTERERNFMERESLRRSIKRKTDDIPLEWMIGPTMDIKDFPPHELAKSKGKPVARIHELVPNTQPLGFGTGFLVAPNILITNHHVFPTKDYADGCVANFLHEKDSDNRILNGLTFKLRPDIFFYSFEDLDYALVYVQEESITDNKELKEFGFLPLIATRGKIIEGSPINIIQHPLGGHKKYAYEQNVITNINDEVGIIEYTTDTQVASSGSPCLNDAWEVAALHYTGVPYVVEGKWRTKTGEVWNSSMPESDIHWVANAGKSISKIVNHIKTLNIGQSQNQYLKTIVDLSGDPLLNNSEIRTESKSISVPQPKTEATMEKMTFNFNGNTTVYFNSPTNQIKTEPVTIQTDKVVATEAKIRFDENYNNRKGYDQSFLTGFDVPAPTIQKNRLNEIYKALNATEPFVLKYHNYSIVMNKKRRMAMWSAANVDYSDHARDNRTREDFGNDSTAWRIDKRIPTKYQIQAEEFYDPATLIDKGHLVRRDDNCWAKNADSLRIEYANSDTFHWTNCTPQHERFNRDMMGYKGLWGVLENALKSQLNKAHDAKKDYNQKAAILAGPVLKNDDPEFNDIQYPLTFWKVFAIVSETEGPLVYGFMLSQEDKVDEYGLVKEARPRFSATVKAMQKTLKEIEDASGVIFDQSLHQYDVLAEGQIAPESLNPDLSNFIWHKQK